MPANKVDPIYLNNELQTFLNKKRTDKDSNQYTHTSIGKPMGSYCIYNNDMEEFLKLYDDVVFNKNIPVHLTEGIRDCEYTPLKIDLDFRYYQDTEIPTRIYTIDDIIKICQLYMEHLENYLESPEDNEREFLVLEKPRPTFDYNKDGIAKTKENDSNMKRVKDGVHIIAPRIVTNANLQLKCREYVYKKVGSILDKYNFDNNYSDIFDVAVINRNNWQMYGSTKPEQPPYLVSKIVKVWKDKYEIIDNNYSNVELVSLCSMRNKFDYSLIRPEKENEVFSEENETLKKTKSRSTQKKKKKFNSKLNEKELKLVIEYIDCLSKTRASNFTQWIELGWCLHNIHNKDDILLNKWIEFSKSDARYSVTAESECKELWENMADEGLGIGSLKLWAKNDNAVLYSKIVQNDIADAIIKLSKAAKGGSSYDVAKVIHTMYKDYFKCVSIKNDVWYYYSDEYNRWLCDDKGIILRGKISTEVWQEFNRLQIQKYAQCLDENDDNSKEAGDIAAVMRRLKDTSFKNNIMTECKELFYDKDKEFLLKLDSNNYLLGFKNGVYDLIHKEFRVGRPEDYISFCTNINYIPYNPDNEDIRDIMEMYKKIFPIRRIRNYIFRRTASFLDGSTKDEIFDIYSGGGGNGKSKHMELLEAAMGDYAGKLPVQLITAKRTNADNASPALAKTKGKRIVSMQEPDTKTRMNVGLMKEWSGGDKIQARALYNEPFEFKPQFKLVLCCNDKPELPSHDDGTWRRLRLVEFICKFVHEPNIDKVFQFKIDTTLSEKFENWAEPFMSILIHYYSLYAKDGLCIPDEIFEYTNEYRTTSNHFNEYCSDNVIEDNTNDTIVSLDAFFENYKKWYKEIYNDNRVKTRKDLIKFLEEKLGKPEAPKNNKLAPKGYKGIFFKNEIVNENASEGGGEEQLIEDELDA